MKKYFNQELLASMMAAAGCASVYISPALNIYFANREQFAVKTSLMLAVTTALFLITVLIPGAMLHLLRKQKFFSALLSLFVAFGVCGVIQYHFSNGFFPDYLREEIYFNDLLIMVSCNVLLLVIPFAVAYKFRTLISRNIVKISLVLLLTQTAYGFLPLVSRNDRSVSEYDFVNYSFTEKDKFSFGSRDNVIVLVVDAMGESIAREMLEKYPEVKNIMRDFTMCDKLTSPVPQTMYAVPAMLSGIPYPVDDNGKPLDHWHSDYLNKACRSEHSLFQALKKLGFRTEGYSFILQTISYAPDVIDNSIPVPNEIKKSSLLLVFSTVLEKFLPVKHSMYHYKLPFLNPQQELAETSQDKDVDGVFDRHFYRTLSEKFAVGTNEKVFKYLHIHGAHDPVHTDEELRENKDCLRVDQLRGSFKIVDLLLSKLKQHSLYDNATIIITGDHSETYDPHTLCFIKRRNSRRKTMAVNSTAHTVSDIAGTILDEYAISSPLSCIKRDEENRTEEMIANPVSTPKYVDLSQWEKESDTNFICADEMLQSKCLLENGHLLIESFPDGRFQISGFRLRITDNNDDEPLSFKAQCNVTGNFRYLRSSKLDLPDGTYRVQLETLYQNQTNEEHLAMTSRRMMNKFLVIKKGVAEFSATSGNTSNTKLEVGKKLKFQLMKEYPMVRLPERGSFKAGYILIPNGSTLMLDLAPGEAGYIKIDVAGKIFDPSFLNVSASNGYKERIQITDVRNSPVYIPLKSCPLDEQLYINMEFEIPPKVRKNIGFDLKIKISGISREKK